MGFNEISKYLSLPYSENSFLGIQVSSLCAVFQMQFMYTVGIRDHLLAFWMLYF